MTAPPTGTVTFLFTDVEGSTRQASADAAAWSAALARHQGIVRAAISDEDGFLFRVIGDACLAAFSTAGRAVAAALSVQRALQAEQWPAAHVKLRMGLHTGPAEWQNGDYEGYLTLARTQRVMAAGHGGQVLLSQAAADLAMHELPSDVGLRDLGEHWLKTLPHPEHLFQLVAADLPAEFPPLRSQGAEPSNLPAQLTSFIGREGELAELRALLSSNRLLTLTGPGGTGKTRLALQLATEVLDTFGAGAWIIELGSVFDPELVAQTVAATLGVRQEPGRTVLDSLSDYVRRKTMLLILDNCEHLIEACARLADALLRIAPGLTILATSRESLGIAGETAFRVPPMTVPDPREPPGALDRLAQNECVWLFVDRASAADPRFRLVERNAGAVSDICRRLDGIPLAIELAAARIRVFPPEQIAARLDDRFRLLTGGSRTALERHQTLKALIDWSYDLLSEPERVLLRRLSVFAGGWSQQAAQEVCDGALADGTLETIARLVEKSMVVVEGSFEAVEGRYRMLETIRQYASEKLLASDESEGVRDRHLEYFLRFAEAAEPKLRGSEQLPWLDRIDMEHDNLRVALAWALETGNSERALRLAGALAYFWELRGDWTVAQGWLEQALSSSGPEQSEAALERVEGEPSIAPPTDTIKARRAKVLYGLGRFRFATQVSVSRAMVEEALQSWRELGDKWWMAVALEHIGFMLRLEGDFETAVARLEEGVSLARAVEDRWPLARCLVRLAGSFQTDPAASIRLYEEGVAIARSVGDRSILSEGLVGLAGMHGLAGNFAAAAPIAAEALAEARAIGSVTNVFLSLLVLTVLTSLQGDPAGAKGYCLELLALGRQTGSPTAQLIAIFAGGFVACFGEDPKRGVRMLSASQALAGRRGMSFVVGGGGGFNLLYQMAVERARAQLEPAAFDAAMQEGQALTLDQALEVATED